MIRIEIELLLLVVWYWCNITSASVNTSTNNQYNSTNSIEDPVTLTPFVVMRDGRRTAQYNKVGGDVSKKGCVFYNEHKNSITNNQHSTSPPLLSPLVCRACTLDALNCICFSFSSAHTPKHIMKHHVGGLTMRIPYNEAHGSPKCRSAGVIYYKGIKKNKRSLTTKPFQKKFCNNTR